LGGVRIGLHFYVCLPPGFQLKRSPESIGLAPDGDSPAVRTGDDSDATIRSECTDLTSRQAMKTWVFWILVISMTARVTCYSSATVHFIPLMVWKGLSEAAAASLLGAFALANLVAHFVLGWIADRVNKPKLLAVCQFLPALAVPPLIGDSGYWELWFFTVVFTFLDASFPIIWATVGDFFGRRHFASIRGMMSFFYMWGSFAGPVMAGAIYDRTQSYSMVCRFSGSLNFRNALMVLFLITPWKRRMMRSNTIPPLLRERKGDAPHFYSWLLPASGLPLCSG
jgi:MFS family permease